MRPYRAFCTILLGMAFLSVPTLAGEDPLSQVIGSFGFIPAVPAPEELFIGDIFERTGLEGPVVKMKDAFGDPEERRVLMESLKTPVTAPAKSGASKFDLTANLNIIGKASLDLESKGARRFSIRFGGESVYSLSSQRWYTELYPKIKAGVVNDDLVGRFVVTSLFQVEKLEYQFYNEKGGKIGIESGSEFERSLKMKLGAEWSANTDQNLTINVPRFLGYRLSRIKRGGMIESYKRTFTTERRKEFVPAERGASPGTRRPSAARLSMDDAEGTMKAASVETTASGSAGSYRMIEVQVPVTKKVVEYKLELEEVPT